MTIYESWQNVGAKIRRLRKSNGLTLKQLALGSDLSANTISLVERSEVAPTIETLCKIAHALGVAPGSFFQEVCETEGDLAQTLGTLCESKILQECLSSKFDEQVVGQFSFMCLYGQVELELDGHKILLSPGNSLELHCQDFHRWRNLDNSTGIAVLVFPAH